jgi:hypothetical protein
MNGTQISGVDPTCSDPTVTVTGSTQRNDAAGRGGSAWVITRTSAPDVVSIMATSSSAYERRIPALRDGDPNQAREITSRRGTRCSSAK